MRLLLARHYWKNGENATWFPAQFPVPEIEAAIHSDYASLKTVRPPYRHYGDWVAFMVYNEAKDCFGRPIVEIRFAMTRRCPDAAACSPAICRALALSAFEQTELSVDLPMKKAMPRPNMRRIIPLVPILLVLIAAAFMLMKWGAEKTPAPALPGTAQMSSEKQADSHPQPSAEANPPAVREITPTKPRPPAQRDRYCESDLRNQVKHDCLKVYIDLRCGDKPELRLKDWLDTDGRNCKAQNVGGYPLKKEDAFLDGKPLSRDREAIKWLNGN